MHASVRMCSMKLLFTSIMHRLLFNLRYKTVFEMRGTTAKLIQMVSLMNIAPAVGDVGGRPLNSSTLRSRR